MKKKTILFAFATLFNICLCNAQNILEETLYLKNGSVIKGQVTEVIPNRQVTILTSTGSSFTVNTNEIEKYTRKPIIAGPSAENNGESATETETFSPTYIEKGYRGFFFGEFMAGDLFQMGVSTTHGYQINKKIFVGGGCGMRICDDDCNRFPLFGTVRLDTKDGKRSPFIEGRIGYEIIKEHDGGAYGSINGGFRCRSFNLSMGFDLFRAYDSYSEPEFYDEDIIKWHTEDAPYTALTFNVRIGFNF